MSRKRTTSPSSWQPPSPAAPSSPQSAPFKASRVRPPTQWRGDGSLRDQDFHAGRRGPEPDGRAIHRRRDADGLLWRRRRGRQQALLDRRHDRGLRGPARQPHRLKLERRAGGSAVRQAQTSQAPTATCSVARPRATKAWRAPGAAGSSDPSPSTTTIRRSTSPRCRPVAGTFDAAVHERRRPRLLRRGERRLTQSALARGAANLRGSIPGSAFG